MQGIGQNRAEGIRRRPVETPYQEPGQRKKEQEFDFAKLEREAKVKEKSMMNTVVDIIAGLSDTQKMSIKSDKAWFTSMIQDAIRERPNDGVDKLLRNNVGLALDTHIIRENINLIGERGRLPERLRLDTLSAIAARLHQQESSAADISTDKAAPLILTERPFIAENEDDGIPIEEEVELEEERKAA
jgi:hypothetical protein